jgi:hypothetical protein
MLAQLVERQLSGLIDLSALPLDTADKLRRVFSLLTRESLEQPVAGPFPGLSRINADGLPFQWVLRVGCGGTSFGFLCEVGTPGDTPRNRYSLSRKRLASACELCGHSGRWLDVVADALIPSSEHDWPEHWRSGLWVGVVPAANGIVLKPYFNLNLGTARDRWLRAGRVLQALGRNRSLATLCELSSLVSEDSWLVGLTVDVLPDGGPGRVKIYFYSDRVGPDWLRRWYEAAGCEAHAALARQFLDLFPLIRERRYPRRAFTLGLEFYPSTEDISLKTDLAVTKWIASDAQLARATAAMARHLGSNVDLVNEYLNVVGAHPANEEYAPSYRFVGLGHEPDASSHLNVYLAPRGAANPSVCSKGARRSIRESVDAGIQFLLQVRQGDCWVDFDLPVGASNGWVTAYTLARLGTVGDDDLPQGGLAALTRSLDWLESVQSGTGGWSYNSSVETDADSTAWAILALRRHGRVVPDHARRLLLSCRERESWFATYPSGDSGERVWRHGAPDVTAAAMSALGEPWTEATEARFREIQFEDGSIPAYWWTSPFYTASLLAEAYPLLSSSLLDARVGAWDSSLAANDFDLALLLSIHSSLGRRRPAERIAEDLQLRQRSDGSWSSSALLRLPPREMRAPWKAIDGGRLFQDINRVFTTATAVAALSAFAVRDACEWRRMPAFAASGV